MNTAAPIRMANSASTTSVGASGPLYTTVSTKGQVVIPAAIRHELGIEPGTRLAMRVKDGNMILEPQSKSGGWRSMRDYTAGGPSGTEILLEDRRLERERELREEGW